MRSKLGMMKPQAVIVIGLIFSVVAIGGCADMQFSTSGMRKSGALSTVRTKGNYEVAAYCFSRAYRDYNFPGKWTGRDPHLAPNTPVVEVAPDQDYGELYVYKRFNVVFFNTGDGNSIAEIFVIDSAIFSERDRTGIANVLLRATKKCHLGKPADS